jgi:RNA polymerase sigma-70 factor (ECF subfamily)
MQGHEGLKNLTLDAPDDEVIQRVLAGDRESYELLVRRYNRRVYRTVRAILRNDDEAEDVMQDAYVRAYQHLAQFEHRASFSTWITRIAVHEALARAERSKRVVVEDVNDAAATAVTSERNPEENMVQQETRELLETSILALPHPYRAVMMLRDVEEMSTAETAEALELSEDAVKVRLFRARAMLRKELFARAGATSSAAFQFHAPRCDRVAAAVLARIAASDGEP